MGRNLSPLPARITRSALIEYLAARRRVDRRHLIRKLQRHMLAPTELERIRKILCEVTVLQWSASDPDKRFLMLRGDVRARLAAGRWLDEPEQDVPGAGSQ